MVFEKQTLNITQKLEENITSKKIQLCSLKYGVRTYL